MVFLLEPVVLTSRFAHNVADEGPARVLEHLAALADLGIEHAMVSPRRPWDEATLDRVAAIVPDVHAIPADG